MRKKVMFFMSLIILMTGIVGYVKAADQTIEGSLTVNGDSIIGRNWLKFNPDWNSWIDPTIDFRRGDSLIKEMGDLYLFSDDYIHLGPSQVTSGKVLIQTPNEIQSKARTASGTLAAGKIETADLTTTGDVGFYDGYIDYIGTSVIYIDSIVDFTYADAIIGLMASDIPDDLTIDDGYIINTPVEATSLSATGAVNFSGATSLTIPGASGAPASADCDAAAELGKMYINKDSGGNVYICTYKQGSIGWDTANLTD